VNFGLADGRTRPKQIEHVIAHASKGTTSHVLRREVALTDESGRGDRAAWDRIAGVLDSPYLSDPSIRASFERFCGSLSTGATVLDVGCGEGAVSAALVARGFTVTGLDQSPRMLAIAARNARGATFVEGDVTDLPFVAEFDALTAAHVLVCLDDDHVQRAGRSMVQALRPGGVIWITVNDTEAGDGEYMGGPMHVHGELMYSRVLPERHVAAALEPLRVIEATRAQVISRFGPEDVLAVTAG
jgi:SAM-dependent methyltransferase